MKVYVFTEPMQFDIYDSKLTVTFQSLQFVQSLTIFILSGVVTNPFYLFSPTQTYNIIKVYYDCLSCILYQCGLVFIIGLVSHKLLNVDDTSTYKII